MKKYLPILIFILALAAIPAFAKDVSVSEAGALSQSSLGVAEFAPLQNLQPQPIYPYLMQLIPGVVGDVTDRPEMPTFDVIQPLAKTDRVIKVAFWTRGGRIMGFSRLEDFDTDLLNLVQNAMDTFGQTDTSRIRFKVLFKMSVKTIGVGGGGGGSMASGTNASIPILYGANASILPGLAVNTSDPKFIIKMYLIK